MPIAIVTAFFVIAVFMGSFLTYYHLASNASQRATESPGANEHTPNSRQETIVSPEANDHTQESPQETEPADNDKHTHSEHTDWLHIIDTQYVNENVLYLPISANSEAGIERIRLVADEPEIELRYKLINGVFELILDDFILPQQSFSFSYESDMPDDDTLDVDAEILFYDMNGDGQLEILIALSSRDWTHGLIGPVASDINWRAVWCVGYANDEGFWQAAGNMVTYFSHGTIYLDRFGERELSESETFTFLRLIERKLTGTYGE